MGWLMQRSVRIDGMFVELDTCDSTLINSGLAPEQPPLFVVSVDLPKGLNDAPGYILCKVGTELVRSGGPTREVIQPIAFAFRGEREWTPCDCWRNRWELASITIPVGNDENGARAITFIPAPNRADRKAYYSYWHPTGYDGAGYWRASSAAFRCQWSNIVKVVENAQRRSPLEVAEVTLLPNGDALFLQAPKEEAA